MEVYNQVKHWKWEDRIPVLPIHPFTRPAEPQVPAGRDSISRGSLRRFLFRRNAEIPERSRNAHQEDQGIQGFTDASQYPRHS